MRLRRAPAALVMWAAILGSVALLGVLLFLGWHDRAGATAAGFLLLACVFVCIWTAAQGRATDREVRRVVATLAAVREAARRRATPGGAHR